MYFKVASISLQLHLPRVNDLIRILSRFIPSFVVNLIEYDNIFASHESGD